jgi:hypothetical protein
MLGSDNAVVFMVSAGLVYEIIAAACSSPQTTEINAASRSGTLMKWVKIGLLQAALFVAIAILIAGNHARRLAAAAGGALAGIVMWASYTHAQTAGLASGGPPTEQYGRA